MALVQIGDFGESGGITTYRINGDLEDLERIIDTCRKEGVIFTETPLLEYVRKGSWSLLIRFKLGSPILQDKGNTTMMTLTEFQERYVQAFGDYCVRHCKGSAARLIVLQETIVNMAIDSYNNAIDQDIEVDEHYLKICIKADRERLRFKKEPNRAREEI